MQSQYVANMPSKTEQELKELVDSGQVVGFTLDTTEFHHVGYNFDAKLLTSLGQFADTNVTLLFSEVILSEVHTHIAEDVRAKSEQLRSALRQVGKAAGLGIDTAATMMNIGVPEDARSRATELIENYLSSVGGEKLSVDVGPTARKLHDLYFGSAPPFSVKADKKNEFPDAMALLSLEHWAEQEDGLVLAISSDGDWRRFADQSSRVIVLPSIAPALNLFISDDAFVAARLAANMAGEGAAIVKSAIDSALEDIIDVFDVEANAPYYYETEDEYATIKEWEVAEPRFDVVASEADFVTLAFPLNVTARFEASFSFTVRDGIDKDYISIGGTRASITESFDAQALVTIARNDDSPDPEVVDLEIEVGGLSVDFGYVEVDYGDDRDNEW